MSEPGLCCSLQEAILPLSAAAMALPPAAIRTDWGALVTTLGRYGPSLLKTFLQLGPQGFMGAGKLLGPFSELVDSLEIRNEFVRNWVDLLSFLLSGLKADGTLAAEVVRFPFPFLCLAALSNPLSVLVPVVERIPIHYNMYYLDIS